MLVSSEMASILRRDRVTIADRLFDAGEVIIKTLNARKLLQSSIVVLATAHAAPEPVDQAARAELKSAANSRMRENRAEYDREKQQQIEELHPIANASWKTDRVKAKLAVENLVAKYKKANRTGCAMLYLGQLSKGDERGEYLETAIKDFSDCYYGDGVQVGGFARYLRILNLRAVGKKDDAEKLEKELRKKHPKAISHSGVLLKELINEE